MEVLCGPLMSQGQWLGDLPGCWSSDTGGERHGCVAVEVLWRCCVGLLYHRGRSWAISLAPGALIQGREACVCGCGGPVEVLCGPLISQGEKLGHEPGPWSSDTGERGMCVWLWRSWRCFVAL